MKKLEHNSRLEIWPLIKKTVIAGLIILGVFVGGFFLWSILTTLDTAAIAPGKVTVDSQRKTIQHLEGGIIKEIHIREGSKVKKGDVLITLDETQAKTRLDLVQGQINQLLATEARLAAERDNKEKVNWPQRLQQNKNNPAIDKILRVQKSLFIASQKTLQGQLKILNQRILQLQKEISSLQAQVSSGTTQLKFITHELNVTKKLAEKGYAQKTKVWALERERARLLGNRDEKKGQIAKTKQQIGETKQRIITLKDKTRKDVLEELKETHRKLADLLEKEKSAEDILNRTQITAPQDGAVVGLQKHTIGGVIIPGKSILQIVPSKDKLIIEAQIKPIDIDTVRPGQTARVQLTAFSQRNTPSVLGKVTHVSAGIFQDEKTGASYYLAQITIPPKELSSLNNIILYPGMPVQVMIISEKRSPFNYFIAPFKQSFKKAFKEQ